MFDKESKAVHRYAVFIALLSLFLVIEPLNTHAQDRAIKWYSMQDAQSLAKENSKKVLAYAEASWCVYCKKMDNEVFPEQAVIDSLNAYFYPVRIDIESNETMLYNGEKITKRQFAKAHKVRATPTTFFLSKEGEILGGQPGFIPADTFSMLLAFVGSGAFREMDFKMYIQNMPREKN